MSERPRPSHPQNNPLEFPMVRITLDHMRQEIMYSFSGYLDGLREGMEAQMDEAIKNFDLKGEIARMTDSILREEIHRALRDTIRSIQWDEGMRKAFIEVVFKELGKNKEE